MERKRERKNVCVRERKRERERDGIHHIIYKIYYVAILYVILCNSNDTLFHMNNEKMEEKKA